MKPFSELYQTGDWKAEKHVPVIEAPEGITAGQPFTIKVSLGKEIAHPNTTAHHISWISLFFLPEGARFPYLIGHADFAAHGASTEGADTSTVYTQPATSLTMKTEKPGTLYATALCNIHGLWMSQQDITL